MWKSVILEATIVSSAGGPQVLCMLSYRDCGVAVVECMLCCRVSCPGCGMAVSTAGGRICQDVVHSHNGSQH